MATKEDSLGRDLAHIKDGMAAILKRLEGIEARLPPERGEKSELIAKLEKLTLKRHAVLTATLGDRSYQQQAEDLGVDVTTIKLHLRAALQILGIPNRSVLLVRHKQMLDEISDAEYKRLFMIGKTWWMEKMPDDLARVLMSTKEAKNQYTQDADS